MRRTDRGRISLRLQFVLLVLALVALAVAVLAVYPKGWPVASPVRPQPMDSPSLVASVDAQALSAAAKALLGPEGGLFQHFGDEDQGWNPLQGRLALTEVTFPALKDGAATVQGKADLALTGWLPWAAHVDLVEATLVPTILDDLKGNVKLVARPVITNLRIREFGDSAVGVRLNQLLAHAMTKKVSPLESKLGGLALSVDIKPAVHTVHFDFEKVVVAAEDDSLLVGAGPVVKRQQPAASAAN